MASTILSKDVLGIVAGVSSVLGVISLCASLYFYSLAQRKSTSLRTIIEGDGLFNSEQIASVLKQFNDDRTRLEALQRLARLDQEKAARLIKKINDNVDITVLSRLETRGGIRYALVSGIIFLLLAGTAVISSPRVSPKDQSSELTAAFSGSDTNAELEAVLGRLE